jgi:putative DNA primase/helicase
VAAESQRLAAEGSDPDADTIPLRLLGDDEKAARDRRIDLHVAAEVAQHERERQAEIAADSELSAQAHELFPQWEGVAKEHERLGFAPTVAPEVAREPRTVSSPSAPLAVAREFVGEQFLNLDTQLTLRHWRGGWWTHQGSHWREVEARAIRNRAYEFTELAVYPTLSGLEPWRPNRSKIGNLLDALAAVCPLDERIGQPAWIDGRKTGPVVATATYLLDLHSRRQLPRSALFFNVTAVPFAYDEAAPTPAAWLTFLDALWPDDPDSIAALQEFFGYVVSGRLDMHKILLIVGPTRGGKGTIARILTKLVGDDNVAGPTLSSLSFDFGLAPLVGKPLAIISDARLDAHRDVSVVVERLLAISGEDTITVNRKYREQWTGKLPTRFLVISNELPRLGDASGTIANRFIVLLLRESWLGREDLDLEARLTAELPGILNWSLEGLDRLALQGRFTRPKSTDETILALQDLASPVAAFVRDRCETGPTYEAPAKALFDDWKAWAEENGNHAGNTQTFGRNLRAVVPSLRIVRPRDGDERERVYRGIHLRTAGTTGSRPIDGHPAEVVPTGPQWSAVHATVVPTSSSPRRRSDVGVAVGGSRTTADQLTGRPSDDDTTWTA